MAPSPAVSLSRSRRAAGENVVSKTFDTLYLASVRKPDLVDLLSHCFSQETFVPRSAMSRPAMSLKWEDYKRQCKWQPSADSSMCDGASADPVQTDLHTFINHGTQLV